jgi:hypothetical protein
LEPFVILIGLVILAGVAFYVSRPLLQAGRQAKASGADASSLEAQRESLYMQIKELDMDHATGKVNDDDYTRLRAELVAQAAEVLKQIDGVSVALVSTPAAAQSDDVEAMIAARRKTRSVPAATTIAAAKPADADVEAAIAARRKTTPTASAPALMCPQCGKPINADDAFCAKCGTALQPQAVR